MVVLNAISVLIIAFLAKELFFGSIIISFGSILVVLLGKSLNEGQTSENWLVFSVGDSFKNIVGWLLIIAGWIIFLRGVLVAAIVSIIQSYS